MIACIKAKVGIEPALTALQAAALPLCHLARKWSGKRGSNPRPQPWQGCALSTELFPHKIILVYHPKNFLHNK